MKQNKILKCNTNSAIAEIAHCAYKLRFAHLCKVVVTTIRLLGYATDYFTEYSLYCIKYIVKCIGRDVA